MSQAGIINIAGGGGGGSPVQTLTGNIGPAVPPTGNNINVIGGTGVSVSGNAGTSTLTINVASEGFTWSEESTSFAAAVQNGYFCNASLTATLPPTAGLTIGNTVIIYADTTGTVTILAQSDQKIQVGNDISGDGGTSVSNTQGSILELIFKPSDLTWHTQSSIGSWATV